jgi:hypothetical protein
MERVDGIPSTTLELIQIYNLCEAFHALPNAGGVLDQDPFLMRALGIVGEVRAEKLAAEQKKAKAK